MFYNSIITTATTYGYLQVPLRLLSTVLVRKPVATPLLLALTPLLVIVKSRPLYELPSRNYGRKCVRLRGCSCVCAYVRVPPCLQYVNGLSHKNTEAAARHTQIACLYRLCNRIFQYLSLVCALGRVCKRMIQLFVNERSGWLVFKPHLAKWVVVLGQQFELNRMQKYCCIIALKVKSRCKLS